MKYAVLTLCDDSLLDAFKKSSHDNLKQYADKINADFFIEDRENLCL